MGLERAYRLKCDQCGSEHGGNGVIALFHDTPRRARAVAKRDGWQRVQIAIREYQMPDWIQTPGGLLVQAGEGTHTVYDYAGRDYCKACADAMDKAGQGEAA